jgi:predicted HTH transcriptional regulator
VTGACAPLFPDINPGKNERNLQPLTSIKKPRFRRRWARLAREHGRVAVAEAARVSGTSRNTIKDHLKALVDQGQLALHGCGRGAWYGLA